MNNPNPIENDRLQNQKNRADSLLSFIKSLPPLLIIVEIIIISVFLYFFFFF